MAELELEDRDSHTDPSSTEGINATSTAVIFSDSDGQSLPTCQIHSESDVVIKDTTSTTAADEGYHDFVDLEADGLGPDEASVLLATCKKYILRPYNFLLMLIGWRRIQIQNEAYERFLSVINILYPLFIFTMLVLACIAQVVTCFSRTRSTPPTKLGNGEYYILECKNNLFTLDVIAYVMILLSYILAFYTFRIAKPEHLSTLAETSILSFNDVGKLQSKSKPIAILLALWCSGIVFFIYSIIVTITRLFSLRLHSSNTIIGWFTSNTSLVNQSEYLKISEEAYGAVQVLLILLSIYGFIFFDLLYIAVIINYCSQCQLLTFYIQNLKEKVRNKKYLNLNLAIKEIRKVNDFLKILNGKISVITTFILLVFVSSVILSYIELTKPPTDDINIATGFLNTIQWLSATLLAALMAARLTASGNELRRLGQEIAARPFYYSDTPDLELHFFLTFTESTRYQVHLLFIPMQPSIVLGFLFIVLIFFTSDTLFDSVNVVTWF